MLSLYNLCIMVCFKYTPHTNYDIRCEVSQGGAPWDAVSMCPKTVSRCPKSVSRCPESVSRCPHFFSGTYFTAASNISQLQALATGICSIQILILVRSTLFSSTLFGVSRYPMWCLKVGSTLFWKYVLLKNVRLHISDNFHLWLKYTPLDAVSICVVKIFYFKK